MRVKTFHRVLRFISAVVLFFFVWTFCSVWEAVAFAATPEARKSGVRSSESGAQGENNKGQVRPEERFEKALEDIREKVNRAGEKADKGEDDSSERTAIKAKKSEVDSLANELRTGLIETERKLKAAGFPKTILTRHSEFVAHFERNVKELRDNLDGIEAAKTSTDRKAKIEKARLHLEKTKKPSTHQKLDPENLPFKTRKATKMVEPRLKKEDYERDFPQQKSKSKQKVAGGFDFHSEIRNPKSEISNKPILLAFNEYASDVPFIPLPSGERTEVRGGLNPKSEISDLQSQIAFSDASPFLLAQAVDQPSADDLAETPDVQFTDAIRAKAQELEGKPVRIYAWVRNNIEYAPTYGSIQGADMCLQTRQCNAFDTNALLISLLRVSNLPAHFVYGTIEIPIDKVMNWVGGFTDPRAAVNFIASGGIPIKPFASGGVITKVQMEHVWVETYIPYGNYRGAIMDNSLKTWIPMDGSFKRYTYTTGFDITVTVPFDSTAYMSQIQNQNPVHYYQSQIQNYLDANLPETSIVDVKGYREIAQETYHFLPSTLPYKTVAQLGKFSAVPTAMAAKVTFTLSNPATGDAVSYTATTNELAGKRITISYIPATSADEALIANYGGFLYDVPAYMLNLKPVLRVEGVIKLTGEATTLGSEQNLTMQFTQPNGNTETRDKKLLAGAYYAVGLDLQGINENVLGKRNYKLNTSVLSDTAGTLGTDDLIGEHLFILATTYFYANDKVQKAGAKLFNVATARTISEGITSFTVTVDHIFGMPKSAMPSGINMDVAMAGVIVSARDGNTSKELAYMDMHGLVGSYNEHDVFEKIDRFSSVSAVKALQTAAANGIPVQKITGGNIAQVLPTLQVSGEVKTDIQNAVNAEKEVMISQSNVQIADWNGVGYIVKDINTGAGAYMISGGLAGSDSVGKATGMEIAELYEGGPLAWILNHLDPMIRDFIVLAADKYIYEQVDEGSPEASDTDAYDAVGQCSGLVRRAYWAAGICLDSAGPPYGINCGKSLASEYNISVGTGVQIHYQLADRLKIYGSVRESNNPLSGDIVFFLDLPHEGIVTTAPNAQGTVEFIHATRKPGVHTSYMNILSPGDPNNKINSFIGDRDTCGNLCLSGQLFSGYGTIRNVHK